VTSAGRAFQTRAPATEKARRPTVGSLTAGTHRSSEVEYRSTIASRYCARVAITVCVCTRVTCLRSVYSTWRLVDSTDSTRGQSTQSPWPSPWTQAPAAQ